MDDQKLVNEYDIAAGHCMNAEYFRRAMKECLLCDNHFTFLLAHRRGEIWQQLIAIKTKGVYDIFQHIGEELYIIETISETEWINYTQEDWDF